MASRENIESKILLLEQRLREYGHVPSQKEDRNLYARVKYYYTNYPHNPIIIKLMEEFPYESSHARKGRKTMGHDESIEYITNELNKLGRIPGPTENRGLYSKVKYFYEKHSDDSRIKELKEKFPLIRKKAESIFKDMTLDEKIDLIEIKLAEYRRIPPTILRNKITSNVLRLYDQYPENLRVKRLMWLYPSQKFYDQTMDNVKSVVHYISKCYEFYGELPGEKSIPMIQLWIECKKCSFKLYSEDGNMNYTCKYVIDCIEKGIVNDMLLSIYDYIN